MIAHGIRHERLCGGGPQRVGYVIAVSIGVDALKQEGVGYGQEEL